MKNRVILLFLAICLLGGFVASFPVNGEAERTAGSFKGYDELITDITPVEYMNKTYFWVDYSKTLTYSGSLLIGQDYYAVEDLPTLELFVIADMIHKNYPPGSGSQWTEFSGYFSSFSDNFRSSYPELSNDSREIAASLNSSAESMDRAIASFSPEGTEEYLMIQEALTKKMQGSYITSLNYSEGSAGYLGEYQKALLSISLSTRDSGAGLRNAGMVMGESIHSRVVSEKNRPFGEMLMIGLSIGLIVFVLVLRRLKR